jgi:hypothetical protein
MTPLCPAAAAIIGSEFLGPTGGTGRAECGASRVGKRGARPALAPLQQGDNDPVSSEKRYHHGGRVEARTMRGACRPTGMLHAKTKL